VTPEATLAVAHKADAGLRRADAADLAGLRADGDPLAPGRRVIRGRSLILNLPGQPKAIRETLEGRRRTRRESQLVPGIFAAVPYCLDLIGGPYVETNESVVKAFRPKSAIRAK
jgi:molybdopterin adenylyltransferase